MRRVLPAERTIFAERELLFHLLLVPLRVNRDAFTFRALHLRHVVLDLSHSRSKI